MNSAKKATPFFLGLSAMLLYTVLAACESPRPREEISVRCPTSTAIVGEPIGEMQVTWTASEPMVLPIQPMASSPDLWVEIETPSGKIGPYQKGEVLPSLPERSLFLVKAGDRLEWTIGYGDFSQSLCSPGTYHIRFRYRVNPGWWNYKQLWKGEVASNEVTIRIDQPTGPDKVLWDRFRAALPNGSCWQFKNWIDNHGGELLKDFPSSTYAAYVFAQQFGYPVSVPPLDKERMCRYLDKLQKDGRAELQDTTRHIATGPDGKELRDARGKPVPLTQGEWLKQTIDLADRISSAHPELPVSEWIRSQIIASYYIQLLEFEKAASVLDALKKSAADPIIRENSGQLLGLLADRGLIAK